MKNFLMIFTAFISPLLPLALIITLFIIIDTFVGRWYARQKGEIITSRKTRIGFCRKTLFYFLVLICVYLIDKFIVNEITRNYIWFDWAFTKFFASILIFIEYTSIDEKVKWIKGEGITDKIKKFFRGLKSIIYGASEIKDRLEK